jgi:hypothetical protein
MKNVFLHMASVLLKKVNPTLYARLKAEAAVQGKTMGEVFDEAVEFWLNARRPVDYEKKSNLEAYLKIRQSIMKHPDEYFVIAKGKSLGRFPSLSDAFQAMKDIKTTKGLIVRAPQSGEWLGGSLQD